MKQAILFNERQRFKQWWLWLILLGVNGLLLWGVFKQVVGGQQFGDEPLSDDGLLVIAGIIIVLTILFTSFRLDTQIKEDGVYARFFPFHLSFKYYSWTKISKSFVRQYNPITEYGGWGLRLGFFGNGKAFNVSGNQGLQIEFSDHKKLLIGTSKPGELTEILKKIGQLKQ